MRRGVVIKLRRGIASQWTSVNPVLADGEMGIETDTRKFKFGDGVKVWTALEYAGTSSELSIETAERIAGDTALDVRLDAIESASSGFGGGGNQISAGTQLAPAGSTVVFSNANGVSFGLNNSSVLTASIAAGVPSPVNFSAGTTSSDLGSVVFSNSNGVSFGLNGSTITASVAVAGGAQTGISGIIVSNTTYTSGTVSFSNANGITFGSSAGQAITASHNGLTSQSNQAFSAAGGSSAFQTLSFNNANGISFSNNAGAVEASVATSLTNIRVSAGLTFNLLSAITFSDANRVSFGLGGSVITASISELINFSAGTQASDLRSVVFSNSNGVSFGLSNGTITAQHNALTSQSNPAVSNSAGSFTFQTLNFSNANNVTFGTSAGGIVTASVAAAGAAAITQSIGMSTQTAGGGTGGTTGYATGDDILYHFVPGSNITMSQSLNGASATLSIYGPAAGGGATISSYENMPGGMWGSSAVTFGATSLSSAVAFQMPMAGSFSFLRIPVLMTMGQTTIATIASATATAQMGQTSTFNAVVYSVGTGASSKSLISVASGSGTVNLSGRISISNSTQGSYTLAYSGLVEGGGTTRTSQYSISNTNYSFSSAFMSEFSSNRFLDIPFANSLAAGQYWLVVGRSTSSSSAGVALSAMTSWGPRYSNHYAGTQHNLLFGVMGSTNQTSIGALIGAGVFSTAGGGTTSGFDISAISSTASNPRMYFQLLRSA